MPWLVARCVAEGDQELVLPVAYVCISIDCLSLQAPAEGTVSSCNKARPGSVNGFTTHSPPYTRQEHDASIPCIAMSSVSILY